VIVVLFRTLVWGFIIIIIKVLELGVLDGLINGGIYK